MNSFELGRFIGHITAYVILGAVVVVLLLKVLKKK